MIKTVSEFSEIETTETRIFEGDFSINGKIHSIRLTVIFRNNELSSYTTAFKLSREDWDELYKEKIKLGITTKLERIAIEMIEELEKEYEQ